MADEVNARDAKLIQYLNEAYGTEKRLETALQAHIGLATRATYKKRLQAHLRETKAHAREVERRIKKLGGKPDPVAPESVEEVAETIGAAGRAVVTGAQKAVALAKGPLHALRGTGELERQLKNAKTEFSDEHEEIATYAAIESLAQSAGDRETAQLAKRIRRDEERMAAFLAKEIPRLAAAVAKAEIPAALRNGGTRRRRAASGRGSATRGSRSRSTTATRARNRRG